MGKRKRAETLEEQAARIRARYKARKREGVCAQGKCRRKVSPDAGYCAKCLAWRNEVTRKRKAALRAARKAAGKCQDCGRTPAKGYACSRCRARKRNRGKA